MPISSYSIVEGGAAWALRELPSLKITGQRCLLVVWSLKFWGYALTEGEEPLDPDPPLHV